MKNTAVVSGPEEGRDRDSDNGSQENILQSYHGILQEVTVSVKSERKSEETQGARSVTDHKVDF